MIIESLELKNYRQYRDQKIVFALGEDNKRITIIQGANGAGKTNILNAITWCLYDEERHLSDAERGLPLVNNISLNDLELEQVCHVKVELVLRIKNSEKMIVTRVATFRKIRENEAEKVGSKFEIFYQENGDLKKALDPELTVNQYLPKDIQEYFFFHCERLDDYFKGPSNSRLIKKEVFKISQLALFESVFRHLKNRNDEYSKDLKDINPKADHIKSLVDNRQAQLNEAKSQLEEYSDKEKSAAGLEKDLDRKLRNYPTSEEIRDWQNRRDGLEKKADQLELQIVELCEEHKDYLIKTVPLLAGYEAISFMQNNISIKDAAGLIPPPYRRSFLKELLNRGFCICHTDFSKNIAAKKKVEEVFQGCDRVTDISDELSVELKNLETMKATVKSFHKEHIKYAKQINRMQKELEEIGIEEKGLTEKVQNADDENISRWEQDLEIVA
ncbi:AAA family ATPase, partial [bacterium]|nr:AAA family ATPase [bacterium]